jgi:hypothetical protein
LDWKGQRFKIWRKESDLHKGLEQISEYMDKCQATEGHLVIFDRNSNITWEEKISHYQEVFQGKDISVWRL